MGVTSLSLFRFERPRDKLWAFNQMALARWPLARIPDIAFFKLMGTGTREGFHPYPNFSVCGILAAWPSFEIGHDRIAHSRVFQSYRRRAAEDWTVFLAPTQCRGSWDGTAPFAVDGDWPCGGAQDGAPVAVITRATIRPRHVLAFWRQVPDIARTTRTQDGLGFKIGLGEIPWFHQVTFTIWRDLAAMEQFAFTGYHRAAIAEVHKGDWFSEAQFARFRVLHSQGNWKDAPALAGRLPYRGSTTTGQVAARTMVGRDRDLVPLG